MKNYVNDGRTVEHTAAATIASGDVVVIGDNVGVALGDAATGESVTVAMNGRFSVAKTTGTAWSQGDKLDWDVSALEFQKGLSSALGDVTDCAIAAIDAASGDATGEIILTPGTGTQDITT